MGLLQSLSNLGNTATGILSTQPSPGSSQTVQQLFVDSLQQLSKPLEEITAAGNDFPKALQILLTFPFPLGKATEFLRSDYANLGLHLDISLDDNLCGLNLPALCNLIHALNPASATGGPSSASSSTGKATDTIMPKPVTLPGLGG